MITELTIALVQMMRKTHADLLEDLHDDDDDDDGDEHDGEVVAVVAVVDGYRAQTAAADEAGHRGVAEDGELF